MSVSRALAAAIVFMVLGGVVLGADLVWVEDAVPAGAWTGADGGDAWRWVNSNPAPFSGSLAHQSSLGAGVHQHYFADATATLTVNPGESLVTYVYLDPANVPSEIVLQWFDSTWEHRAYWGANLLPWGTDGTASQRPMGPLPPAGQWARLEVPASLVGLEGSTLKGMSFTLYGGRATWDHAGKTASGSPDTTPPTVALTEPGNNATVSGTVRVSASASDNTGIAGVQFKLDGGNLGPEVTAAPYSIMWDTTIATNGSHTLTATARDAAGNQATSGPVVVSVNNSGSTAPANDAFANAQTISGSSGTTSGSNVNATKETGEPNHAGNAGGHSVWYRWTAGTGASVTMDTLGSGFDTLLAVYTGNSVGSLTGIVSNDDISTNNNQSRVTFTPVAGATYQIAVDGWNGAVGAITLNWAQASQNLPDLIIWGPTANPRVQTVTFATNSCAVVEGLVQAGTRKLLRFSTETRNQGNADLFLGNPATNSQFVWAPCHGHYHFNNYAGYRLLDGSGQSVASGLKIGFCLLDTIRWSPSAPSSAKYSCTYQGIQQGWGDLYDSTLDGQWIDITGVPDGNYTLELKVNPQRLIPESNYDNNTTLVPVSIGNVPPANDNFANAQGLSGSSASVSGSNTNATKEAGEPNHAGNAGGHSVWYFWTAPGAVAVTVDTVGSSFDTLLAVYTGNSVTSLTPIVSNDDLSSQSKQSRVSFTPVSGATYRIAVDGRNGATGSIVLTLNQNPVNDNFAECQFIGGTSGTITGSSVNATKEGGEPNHASNRGGHSIWYCWTAPNNGSVTFDTIGSTFDTLLAVYVGNSVDTLASIASNDDIANNNRQSRVTFNAVATTQYHIVIDGYNGASGNTTLNWNMAAGAMLALQSDPSSQSVSPGPGLPKDVLSVDTPPTLDWQLLPEGEYQAVITGQPLHHYTVEVSCNLTNWLAIGTTLADAAGTAYFRDKSTAHGNLDASNLPGPIGPIGGLISDPICGAQNLGVAGLLTAPTESRFYRVVDVP